MGSGGTSARSGRGGDGVVVLAQRVSFSQFPEPQPDACFLHSRRHDAHAGLSDELLTDSIRRSAAWQDVMVPTLRDWDRRRRLAKDGVSLRRGPAPMYSAEELETAELFRRVMGAETYKATCERLSAYRSTRARKLLHFDRQRQEIRRGEPFTFPGVPSEAAMSRYRRQMGDDARAELWGRFLARLRRDYAALSSDDSSRTLYADGTHIRVAGSCRILNRRTREIVNADQYTVRGGGYVPVYHSGSKGGHGFNLMTMVDDRGVPVAHVVDRINEAESHLTKRVVEQWAAEVRPHYPTDTVRVLSADAACGGAHVRAACRRAGIIENVHAVSHGSAPRSRKRAKQFDRKRIGLDGTKDWQLNGHRELVSSCGCETPTLARSAWLDRHGRARVRIKGVCSTCGSTYTLTSGRKRRAKRPDRLVRKDFWDRDEQMDLAAGNPFTFNDPLAARLGTQRWSRDEGFHGVLAVRYKLNRKRRRYRSRRQAELESNIVFSIMTCLSVIGRQHEAAADAASLAA